MGTRKPKPDFCREAASRGDLCCENAVGDFFLCGGRGGSCCGNACAAVGSKCCKVGTFAEWYPVSNETECREGGDEESPIRATTPVTLLSLEKEASKPKPDFCREAVSRGDLCCENAVGDFFLCGGRGGSCCGNACAGVGSKCCKVGTFAEWYPVSKEPECSRVCKSVQHGSLQCYPKLGGGFMGTPCGVLSQGNPQGCFFNAPTSTCALCDTGGQSYCCPTSDVEDC